MERSTTDSAIVPATDPHGDACTRIRRALEHGAPWDACDSFRDAVAAQPGNPELLYCGALAHARAGAAGRAHSLLDSAEAAAPKDPSLLADILSLRGRLWKDGLHRARDPAAATGMAERARAQYLAAYALLRDPYPGINAATLSMLLGDRDAAAALAEEIGSRLATQTTPRSCWDHATAGEAQLLLGRIDLASRSYAAARALAHGDAGTVATMRRQLRLLARALPEAAAVLDALPAAAVIGFAGHMIDAPGRSSPRFPAWIEATAAAAIRDRLARLSAPIVYTSAACGADLLCVEAALDLGAEVNVVLPFDRDDFVRTSVAVGGEHWVRRFDRALAGAARVIPATTEGYLDDDVLFEHAAILVEGLAALRARQLETSPSLLCLFDVAAPGRVGGTHTSVLRWTERFGPPEVIDLHELRDRASRESRGSSIDAPAAPALPERPVGPVPRGTPAMPARPQRTLKTLLFADFAGYSRLHDTHAPLFQGRFWQIAADALSASPVKPLMANTWGDAIYVVFESPLDGAEFALGLLASMRAMDWTAAGLSGDSQIRIALHAGPVFCGFDPVMGRDNYFGASVTRAARIEPVTPPGMVYASEAFAATLAATGQDAYVLEYVGRLALAKGYGESRVYRLDRP